MTEIEWEDPPYNVTRRSDTDWGAFVDELKLHPGKWALARVCRKSGSCANYVQRLKFRGAEAVSRRKGDGWNVYARWPEDAS